MSSLWQYYFVILENYSTYPGAGIFWIRVRSPILSCEGETLNETKNQKETWKWKTPFGKLKTQKLA
jgi:hypothetical protein